MLVEDLIAQLQTLDPKLPVLSIPGGWDQWNHSTRVDVINVVQVCDDDHPAPFASGGKPRGDWFKAVVIR